MTPSLLFPYQDNIWYVVLYFVTMRNADWGLQSDVVTNPHLQALLGGATCESSAKMTADEIFGPGLRLVAALTAATGVHSLGLGLIWTI